MSTQNLPPPGRDPLLERADHLQRLERLERLARRRTGTASGPPTAAADPAVPARTKRHHPARVARLGALAVSCLSAGGLTYLFAGINESQATAQSLDELPTPISTGTQTGAAAPTTSVATVTGVATAASTPTESEPTSTTAATAASTVQAFDGEVVNTRYGPVQVQVQITDGAISEVAVVEYPTDDGKSVRINARALPTLRSEALTAQSADIDTVSGATYTSEAYAQSLQSAIDQARLAGATALV